MKVLSLFSGIGGFDLGLERAGMEVVGQCEIDPFCNKVLGQHWPEVPRYGDVRSIGVGRPTDHGTGLPGWTDATSEDATHHGPVDLICGGFPCQDLSVAGKRAGLDGARSGLWFEFHRILSELRPSVALIENVPGLLSSNGGRDFGIILRGLDDIWPGRWGWAVLDSQHFGVPQRRRRLYVIAGPRRERIAQILSLCESGDWHSKESREAGEDFAGTLGGGAYGTGRRDEDDPNLVLAKSLLTKTGRLQLEDTYVPDLAYSVLAREHKGMSQREGVTTLVAHSLRAKDGTHVPADANDANLIIAHTLRAEGFDAGEDGTGRGTPLVWGLDEEQNGAEELMGPLKSRHESGGHQFAVSTSAAVRRLTPVECERLQGFPDSWTQLDDRTPDGPRYKALGNAVTVPVIEYIGKRIMSL